MKKNKKLWSFALAGALAVSNLSGVAAIPFTTIVAKAAEVSLGSWTLPAEGADRKLDLGSLKDSDTTKLTFTATSVDGGYGLDKDGTFFAIPTISVNGGSYEGDQIPFDYTKTSAEITADVSGDVMKAYAKYGNGDASVSFQLYKADESGAADRQIPVGDPIVLTLETNNVASIELDTSAAKNNIGLSDNKGFTVKAKSAKKDDGASYAVSDLETTIMSDAELKTYTDALEAFNDQLDVIQGIEIPVITEDSDASEIAAYETALKKLETETKKLGDLGNAVQATASTSDPSISPEGIVTTTKAKPGNYNVVVSDGDMTVGPFFGEYVTYPFEVIDDSVALTVTSSKADAKSDPSGTDDTITSMIVGSTDQIKVKVANVDATSEELAKITWESSQPLAVSVNENGEIEALKKTLAKTTITGKYKIADDVTKEIKFYVTAVDDPEISIVNADDSLDFDAAETNVEKEIVVMLDSEEYDGEVEWKITKNGASTTDATISDRTFMATVAGTYKITATAEVVNGYKVTSDEATITVADPKTVVSVKNSAGAYTAITGPNPNLNDAYNKNGNKEPFNTGDVVNVVIKVGNKNVTSDYTWKSYNDDIATVEDGVITMVGEGSTKVGYKLGTGAETLLSLTVDDSYRVVYELDGKAVADVYPEDIVDLKLYNGNKEITSGVTWEVENVTIATVSGSKLTVKKDGTIILNAYLDGTKDPVHTDKLIVSAATVSFTDEYDADVAVGDTVDMLQGESRSFVAVNGNKEISGTWSVSADAKKAGITVSDGTVKIASSTKTDTYSGAVIFKYDGTNYGFDLKVEAEKITVTTAEEITPPIIAKGKTIQLIAKNGSEDITNNKEITFRVTEGSTHISVDENNGLVTGLSQGSGVVTVYKDGTATTATITIKVNNLNKATAISLDKSSLALNCKDVAQLTAKTTPEGTSDTVIWTSSNEDVATVEEGLVTAVGEGTAVITASVGRDDEVSPATCKVTVTKSQEQADAAQAALDAAEKAIEAAKAAESNPTAETVKAAQDAAAAATAAAKAAAEVGENEAAKEAEAAAKTATDAATAAQAKIDEAAKKSDGSTSGTPAAAGTELKDANGNATGFVVTDATASAPTVEYKGTDADKKATKLTIPATVKDHSGNTYTVTSIAKNAFKGDKKLTKVIIPSSIKEIKAGAFKNAKNLKKVTINAGGKLKVAKSAFKGLKKGSTIKVKGSNKKANIKTIKKAVTASKTTVK